MAVDKKAIAAMARKKKPKMPKASTKDLKAVEVADASPALIESLFGFYRKGADEGYKQYKLYRQDGFTMEKAFEELFWEGVKPI